MKQNKICENDCPYCYQRVIISSLIKTPTQNLMNMKYVCSRDLASFFHENAMESLQGVIQQFTQSIISCLQK